MLNSPARWPSRNGVGKPWCIQYFTRIIRLQNMRKENLHSSSSDLQMFVCTIWNALNWCKQISNLTEWGTKNTTKLGHIPKKRKQTNQLQKKKLFVCIYGAQCCLYTESNKQYSLVFVPCTVNVASNNPHEDIKWRYLIFLCI